jgi:hypothetical protein
MSKTQGRPIGVSLLLVGLPVWLALSAAVALWLYYQGDEPEQPRFSQAISGPMLADDLKKFVEVIGERHASAERPAANLGRAAAMIEGLLGPSNTGYAVHLERGPAQWPLVSVTLRGGSPAAAPVWVVAAYDSRPGSRGAEANASGVVAALAAARAMAADTPARSVRFVFLPHDNDPGSPVEETTAILLEKLMGRNGAAVVWCVEAMGASEDLELSARDAAALPPGSDGLVATSAETGVDGLAGRLAELGLPAVRVATRRPLAEGEADDRPPFSGTVVISAGKLVELIRQSAARIIDRE